MIGSELLDVDDDISAKINKTRPTYVYLQLYSITKLQNIHDRIGLHQTYNSKVGLISKRIGFYSTYRLKSFLDISIKRTVRSQNQRPKHLNVQFL